MKTYLYIPTFFGISIEVYLILIILGVPTFFFWRWLLKKFIKSNNIRKIVSWAATILVTPIIYVGIILIWFISLSYHPTHAFNHQKWISDKEQRYELSDDIIDSNMLLGKTKAEVLLLLGEEGNAEASDNWSYYLGFKPGFANIDPYFLSIEFENGKVVRVGQHES